MAASVVVGPVIGKCDTTTARVLLEVSCAAKVRGTLTSVDDGVVASVCEVDMPQGRPRAFVFQHLQEDTEYCVSFSGISNSEECLGRLHTFPSDCQAMVIIAAACDNLYRRGEVRS